MVHLEAVSKRYGPRTVVHDLSFEVRKGEIVGFLGPNGAGKTTTMRMIAGFTTPSRGRVTVAGFDMATQNVEAARRIGYLPENPPLYDVMDVSSYLRFVAKARGVPRIQIAAQLDRVIAACHLEAVVRKEIYKLSKGYRQRVGLAQALLGNPEVLLLDEPTAGLDPAQIHETREVIRAFGRDHAVLLSTHILPEVTMICQRVAIINGGRLLAVDTPQGLQEASEQTGNVSLDAVAPASDLREALFSLTGVTAVDIRPIAGEEGLLRVECQIDASEGVESRIARVVTACWSLRRLERREPTLENVFLRYVAQDGRAREAA